MGHRKRSLEPDRIWHVMARGVRQSPLFLGDDDQRRFLQLLRWVHGKWPLRIFCYCLMDNHYHFLLQGRGKTIGRALQMLNGTYAREFNSRIGTNGHLFQGRFKAYPAKSLGWAVRRSTYIHLNPVEAGMTDDPYRYPWSSLRSFTEAVPSAVVLDTSTLLEPFGGEARHRQASYSELIYHESQKSIASREFARKIQEI